jgi:predicted TIM-barrel fold metal-dependent hydrolase
MEIRDDLLSKNPQTTFIACHLSNQGHDLAALSLALEQFPNLYADISARDYELGRQPRYASDFLNRFRDRILFGTDMGREKHMYEGWWQLLETADEFIPGRLWWRLYGLELEEPLLKALYRSNAEKLLLWE